MATPTQRLSDIAKTVRSKNAGVDKITFDIMFPDRATYERVKASGALTRETVRRLYRVDDSRITGARFEPWDFRVKLEGAGKTGERYVGMVGIRDPYTIAHIDEVIGWARGQARERFGDSGYELHYTVYGRNGVMGDLEPLKQQPAHEVCVLVQAVAPSAEMAEELCMIGTRQMFYARLPEVKGSAGSVAFALDEVLRASPAYRWTLNHTLRCHDPLELFPTHMTVAGVK